MFTKIQKNIKTQLFIIFVPLEGNFGIDAGDGGGGGWGDHSGPFKSPKHLLKLIKVLKKTKTNCLNKYNLSYLSPPPEGNFDIDAGDWGNQLLQIPNIATQIHFQKTVFYKYYIIYLYILYIFILFQTYIFTHWRGYIR